MISSRCKIYSFIYEGEVEADQITIIYLTRFWWILYFILRSDMIDQNFFGYIGIDTNVLASIKLYQNTSDCIRTCLLLLELRTFVYMLQMTFKFRWNWSTIFLFCDRRYWQHISKQHYSLKPEKFFCLLDGYDIRRLFSINEDK
jgi:hypothetical protein